MFTRRKLTEERAETFLHLLENGNTITSICAALGIDTSTYRHYRLTHPEFAQQVDDIKKARELLVEDALYAAAMSGNVKAQIFWLCNRAPERWRSARVEEITGAGGGPLVQEVIQRVIVKRSTESSGGTEPSPA